MKLITFISVILLTSQSWSDQKTVHINKKFRVAEVGTFYLKVKDVGEPAAFPILVDLKIKCLDGRLVHLTTTKSCEFHSFKFSKKRGAIKLKVLKADLSNATTECREIEEAVFSAKKHCG